MKNLMLLMVVVMAYTTADAQKKPKHKDVDALFYESVNPDELEEIESDLETAGGNIQNGGAIIAVGGLLMVGAGVMVVAGVDPLPAAVVGGIGFLMQMVGALQVSGGGKQIKEWGRKMRRKEEAETRRRRNER